MNLSYKNNKLEKSLTDDKKIIRRYGKLAKKIRQRISELKAAENLEIIAKLPALRLHQYAGNRKGEWSIDIQQNWRIIFELNHNTIPKNEDGGVSIIEVKSIKIVSIEDPH